MDYITLQGRVEDELNRPDMSARIQNWINEVRDEIADGTIPILTSPSQGAHKFSWTYASTAVSTSTQNNDWPDGFIEEISFFEVSQEKPLVKVDAAYFDSLLYSDYNLSDTGTPTNYVDRGTSYDLFPTPSSAVELYLRYYSYPTALSNQGDEYTVDEKVPSLIIAATCLKAARFLHDVDLINIFKQYTQEYYVAAVNKDRMGKWRSRQLRIKTYGDFDMSYWKGMHQIGDNTE